MDLLINIFKVLGLITGILFLLVIIFSIIKVFIDRITYKKRFKNKKEEFIKELNEMVDLLDVIEKKTKKPIKNNKNAKKNAEK